MFNIFLKINLWLNIITQAGIYEKHWDMLRDGALNS